MFRKGPEVHEQDRLVADWLLWWKHMEEPNCTEAEAIFGLKGLVDKEDVENPLYIRDIDHNDVTGVMHSPSDQWDKKNRQIVSLLVILYASRLE